MRADRRRAARRDRTRRRRCTDGARRRRSVVAATVVAAAGLHAVLRPAGRSSASPLAGRGASPPPWPRCVAAALARLLLGEAVALAVGRRSTVVGIAVRRRPARRSSPASSSGWADLLSATQPADLTAAAARRAVRPRLARRADRRRDRPLDPPPALPVVGPLARPRPWPCCSAPRSTRVALAQGAAARRRSASPSASSSSGALRRVDGDRRRGSTEARPRALRSAAVVAMLRGRSPPSPRSSARTCRWPSQRALRPARPGHAAVGSAGGAQPARRAEGVARRRRASDDVVFTSRRQADRPLAGRRARRLRRRRVDRRQRQRHAAATEFCPVDTACRGLPPTSGDRRDGRTPRRRRRPRPSRGCRRPGWPTALEPRRRAGRPVRCGPTCAPARWP